MNISNNAWLLEWSNAKVKLALRLNKGECDGSYAEAIIILCSVLSGISADVWPGRNIDRKRFVELLIKYTSTSLNCDKVSIPLLVGALRDTGNTLLADQVKKELLPVSDTRVITSDDVDKTILELISLYPNIEVTVLKENTYANILYREIRSGFVHEYRPGKRSESKAIGAARNNNSISYFNMARKLDRLIFFNVSWLSKLVEEVAESLSKSNPMPVFNNYNNWWLDR